MRIFIVIEHPQFGRACVGPDAVKTYEGKGWKAIGPAVSGDDPRTESELAAVAEQEAARLAEIVSPAEPVEPREDDITKPSRGGKQSKSGPAAQTKGVSNADK